MYANKTGGMPPELKSILMAALAARFPGMEVEVEEAKTDSDTAESEGDGFAQHRSHLVELIVEHDEVFNCTDADEVVESANKLFQYITTGKVPA